MWWESQIERDMIYLLEFDRAVLTYREQPLRIQYELAGEVHLYTPDFLAQRKGRRQLIEVKPAGEAEGPENQARFRAIGRRCREDGYEFFVATDDRIRLQPRLDIIKLLWRYSRVPLSPHHFIYCRDVLSRRGFVRLADAFRFFESRGAARAAVYALLWRGVLEVDLMRPLCADAIIYRAGAAPNAGGAP